MEKYGTANGDLLAALEAEEISLRRELLQMEIDEEKTSADVNPLKARHLQVCGKIQELHMQKTP